MLPRSASARSANLRQRLSGRVPVSLMLYRMRWPMRVEDNRPARRRLVWSSCTSLPIWERRPGAGYSAAGRVMNGLLLRGVGDDWFRPAGAQDGVGGLEDP